MYELNNYGKLFSDELKEWLLEAGFIQYQFQMSIYYKYAPYGKTYILNNMLIIVSIGIHQKLLEMVYGHSRK